MTSVARIHHFIEDHPGLFGVNLARKALRFVIDGSASPAESTCVLLLCLPYRLGGFSLPAPRINHIVIGYSLITNPESGKQTKKRNIACDLVWKGLVLEYDSKQEHGTYEKMEKDAQRRNDLSPSAKILQATSTQIAAPGETEHLARTASRILSCRIQPRYSDFAQRQTDLRTLINHAHRSTWLKYN